VGAGMETHASFAPLSAGWTDAALDRYADALATELVLASRALHVAGRPPQGDGTRALLHRLGAESPSDLEDRPLADDVRRAREVLTAPHAAPADRAVLKG
jgi:histidine ammonia-lyase